MKYLVSCAANAAEILTVAEMDRAYRSPYTNAEKMKMILSHERLRILLAEAEAKLTEFRDIRSIPETCPHCGDACDLLPKPKEIK